MWVEKKLVKEINEATKKQMGPQLEQAVNFLKRLSDRIINGEEIAPIYKLLAGADSYMRRVANNKIADVFHVRSQQARSARDASSASVLGMIGELRQSREKLNNLFIDMVGEASDPYVIDALREASSDKNDQELSALAQQVRAFYREVYDTYIEPSNSNIKKAKNYSPIVLDLEKIAQDPDAFIDLILTETGQLNDAKA